MMHYRKGENIEKEAAKQDLPFKDCTSKNQEDILWMHVKGSTKVSNLIAYAKNALDSGQSRTIVWSGSESGVVKTISCAEILKQSYPMYQVTRMCYKTIEEFWKPQMDGLEEIVAKRQIPCLHILMSLDKIDDSISGLQKPNTKTDFWTIDTNSSIKKHQKNQQFYSGATENTHQRRFNKIKNNDDNNKNNNNDNNMHYN